MRGHVRYFTEECIAVEERTHSTAVEWVVAQRRHERRRRWTVDQCTRRTIGSTQQILRDHVVDGHARLVPEDGRWRAQHERIPVDRITIQQVGLGLATRQAWTFIFFALDRLGTGAGRGEHVRSGGHIDVHVRIGRGVVVHTALVVTPMLQWIAILADTFRFAPLGPSILLG